MKKFIDLTHTITMGTPVIHTGLEAHVENFHTIKTDGVSVQKITLGNHFGTHIDAPSHFIDNSDDVENVDIGTLCGESIIIDFTDKAAGDVITAFDLNTRIDKWENVSRIILTTGWDIHYGSHEFFENYPVIDISAAKIIAEKKVLVLGMDTPSPGPLNETGRIIHRILLGANVVLLESLKGLRKLKTTRAELFVFPLLIEGCSGAPCRAAVRI